MPPQIVTRKDVEDALDRIEKGEALPEDATMLRAIVHAYYALVEEEIILEPD